jgi:hypothetical protein
MVSNRIMPAPLAEGKQYQRFSLKISQADLALLADEHEIILNLESGHYTILNWDVRYLVADGFFSQEELRFISLLLERWPSFVPNDLLLQVVIQQDQAQITQFLDTQHDQALGLLHTLAGSCRHQLRPYGIEIEDIDGYGYKLSCLVGKEEMLP